MSVMGVFQIKRTDRLVALTVLSSILMAWLVIVHGSKTMSSLCFLYEFPVSL